MLLNHLGAVFDLLDPVVVGLVQKFSLVIRVLAPAGVRNHETVPLIKILRVVLFLDPVLLQDIYEKVNGNDWSYF